MILSNKCTVEFFFCLCQENSCEQIKLSDFLNLLSWFTWETILCYIILKLKANTYNLQFMQASLWGSAPWWVCRYRGPTMCWALSLIAVLLSLISVREGGKACSCAAYNVLLKSRKQLTLLRIQSFILIRQISQNSWIPLLWELRFWSRLWRGHQ